MTTKRIKDITIIKNDLSLTDSFVGQDDFNDFQTTGDNLKDLVIDNITSDDIKYDLSSGKSVKTQLDSKATNDNLLSHTNSNYITSDPHQIILNAEQFRQSIDVYNKNEVNKAISNVKTFVFKGYFGNIDPSTVTDYVLRQGDFWYEQEDFLDVVPQNDVNILIWDGLQWQEQLLYPDGANIHFDTWTSTVDDSEWYWFNGWQQLDATGDGVTIGMNEQGKLEVIDASITQVKFAEDVISNQTVREFNLTPEIDGVTNQFLIDYDLTALQVLVFHNGLKLLWGTDYTTTVSAITLTNTPQVGDTLTVVLQGFLPAVERSNNLFFQMFPDIDNIESANLTPTPNISFTMQNDGYLQFRFSTVAAGGFELSVNNEKMQSLGVIPGVHYILLSKALKKGDIVLPWTNAVTGGYIMTCFIPPIFKSFDNITFKPVNQLLTMGPPDWSQASTAVQWTTNGLEREMPIDGYIVVHMNATSSSGTRQVIINDITIASHSFGGFADIFCIKKGDRVKLTWDAAINSATYQIIPPVLNPPQFLEAQPVLDYSTVEQDTGRRWIDKRTIYQITGTIAPANIIKTEASQPNGNTTWWYVK